MLVQNWKENPFLEILANCSDKPAVRNNGGGYYNHCLFLGEVMSPNGGGNPSGALAEAIDSALVPSRDLKILFRKRQQRDLFRMGLVVCTRWKA